MTAWQGAAAPAPREAAAAAARLEARVTWDEALAVIDKARREQAAAPGLAEPAKKALATLDREWDGLAAHRGYPMISLDDHAADGDQPARRDQENPTAPGTRTPAGSPPDLDSHRHRRDRRPERADLPHRISRRMRAQRRKPLAARAWNGSCPGKPPPKTSAHGRSRQHPDNHTKTATATASPRTRSRRPLASPITGLPNTYH